MSAPPILTAKLPFWFVVKMNPAPLPAASNFEKIASVRDAFTVLIHAANVRLCVKETALPPHTYEVDPLKLSAWFSTPATDCGFPKRVPIFPLPELSATTPFEMSALSNVQY